MNQLHSYTYYIPLLIETIYTGCIIASLFYKGVCMSYKCNCVTKYKNTLEMANPNWIQHKTGYSSSVTKCNRIYER